MPITYPLDLSGTQPSNLIEGELHTVNEARFRDYSFLVPNFAPFFVDNFSATISVNGISRPLVEDVDFSFALSYVTGTRTTGKQMYGAVTLHNLELNGIIIIKYRTIGGNQTADKLAVLTQLADKAYNPRTTIWDIVTDVPEALPPTPHYQDYDTFFGQDAVVDKLQAIAVAIAQNSSLTTETLHDFLEVIGVDTPAGFVNKNGDTMRGPLILVRDPEAPMEAVNKQFMDLNFVRRDSYQTDVSSFVKQTEVASLLATKLSVTGGEMTGPITLNAVPTEDLHAVNKNYVDNKVSGIQTELNDLKDQVNALSGNGITREEVESLIGEVMLRLLSRPV